MRGLLRVLVAAAAGLGAGLAFPPHDLAWLLPVAVAGLSLVVRGVRLREGFALGLVFGLAFMLLLLPWIQVIGVDAWIGLSVLEAAFYGLLGAGLVTVGRLPAWPVWSACLWVAVEALRGVLPWGGFPWGRLAFATADTPLAGWMAWVGAAGTTFVVALLGTTLAWAVVRLSQPRRLSVLVGVAAALALAAAAAVFPVADVLDPTSSPGSVRVAAVQGNVPGEGMDAFAERRAVLDNHVEATLDLAERVRSGRTAAPDMVLWPENSTDIDPFADPTVYRDISAAVDAVGVPTLVGAMVAGPGPIDVRNQVIVWEPGSGPGQAYSKTHLVPFGEYIPMRAQLATLFSRLDQIPRDMIPGTEAGVLDMAGRTIGAVTCFEVVYDGLLREVVSGGAQMLVVPTNNATYMGTGQIEQQFAISRLRALETGRWVAVVATNGVSGIIAPDGSVTQRAPTRQTVVLEADLPLLTGLTPAVRWGALVERALTAVAVLALLAGAMASRRRRASRRAAERPAPLEAGV